MPITIDSTTAWQLTWAVAALVAVGREALALYRVRAAEKVVGDAERRKGESVRVVVLVAAATTTTTTTPTPTTVKETQRRVAEAVRETLGDAVSSCECVVVTSAGGGGGGGGAHELAEKAAVMVGETALQPHQLGVAVGVADVRVKPSRLSARDLVGSHAVVRVVAGKAHGFDAPVTAEACSSLVSESHQSSVAAAPAVDESAARTRHCEAVRVALGGLTL